LPAFQWRSTTMIQILVVEDDPAFRSVVGAALTKYGYSVIEASDGRAGLEVLKAHPIDLIVTELLMPEMDGIELIVELRETKNTIPIIAMTGRPDDTEVYLNVAKAFGAKYVFKKPFLMDDFISAVRSLLSP
jgi:DNA-binding response OmpR family regulator